MTTITAINGTELKMMSRKDRETMPKQEAGTSFFDWMESFENHGHTNVHGKIGFSGTKTHKIYTAWVEFNGEKMIVSAYSICGSQSYRSGMSIVQSAEAVTCKKCSK